MFGESIPIHVIDFEGAPNYGVVEYGVATLHGMEITHTFTRLCRAYAPIDPSDIAVHGITYEQSLAYAPFEDDYQAFVSLRKSGPLAAHNARYEARLVKKTWDIPGIVPAFVTDGECATWGPWIDSCALARKLAPGLERYKLQAVVESLDLANELEAISLDKCPEDRRMYHAALYDAIAAALILKKLLCRDDIVVTEDRLFSVKA